MLEMKSGLLAFATFLFFLKESHSIYPNILFIKSGGNILLNCSGNSGQSVIWRHNKDVYSVGSNVNKKVVQDGKIALTGNHDKGEFNLKVLNIGKTDEGTYWCTSSKGDDVIDLAIDVQIMTPPSDIIILNNTHNIIHTEEGRLTTLTCTVKTGIPPEILSFYRDGEIVMNGSGKVTFSFIPESSDHLNIYVCRAKHDALDNPLEVSIQLILARKPVVNVVAIPTSNIAIGDNVSLLCQVDNPIDLTNIIWTKDNKTLHNRLTEVFFFNAASEVTGTYGCTVENKYGRGSSYISIQVKDGTTWTVRKVIVTTEFSLDKKHNMTLSRGFEKNVFLLGLLVPISFVLLTIVTSVAVVFKIHEAKRSLPLALNSDTPGMEPSNDVEDDYEEIDEEGLSFNVNALSRNVEDVNTTGMSSSSENSSNTTAPTMDIDGYLNPYHSVGGICVEKEHSYLSYDSETTKDETKLKNTPL